jgi:predicted DNA-binding transcriptional regulator AlpA
MAKTTKPRARSLPVKPGQGLLSKPQMLEVIGSPAYSTVWGWMKDGYFPLPIELGPPDGRTSLIAWRASEVYEWLATRPRRQFGLHEFRGAPKDEEKKPAKRKLTPRAAR